MNSLMILIAALILVESDGVPRSGDGGRAQGILQIHRCVVQDVNRIAGYKKFTYRDRHDAQKSVAICKDYLAYYCEPRRLGRQPTLRDYAVLWNCGPDGLTAREGPVAEKADAYWTKVRERLAVLDAQQMAQLVPAQ
ncbi:MAG: hypothetical protein HY343_13305 [Lentisphaerae bacterium]|nr:hypothetical protein [Lentisphaerota bacterium]